MSVTYRPSVGKLLLDVREVAREALRQESKGNRNLSMVYVGKLRDLVTTLESITEGDLAKLEKLNGPVVQDPNQAYHESHGHDNISGRCLVSE